MYAPAVRRSDLLRSRSSPRPMLRMRLLADIRKGGLDYPRGRIRVRMNRAFPGMGRIRLDRCWDRTAGEAGSAASTNRDVRIEASGVPRRIFLASVGWSIRRGR